MMAEYDNTGIPLAYCLLSMVDSITPGKRKTALESFFRSLRDKYTVHPKFVHTDKDIAKIKGAKAVWVSAKHQLCWWHVKKAVSARLKESHLGTSPYHIDVAHTEFSFIDLSFIPMTRPNDQDTEDMLPDPLAHPDPPLPPQPTLNPNALPIRISIPAGLTFPNPPILSDGFESENDDLLPSQRFCPLEHRKSIIAIMGWYYCAHLLIPSQCAPNKEGIRYWAVKQMYDYCFKHGLRACWAYLWENWYCCSHWELWARAECEEIPRLKTTMICESQYVMSFSYLCLYLNLFFYSAGDMLNIISSSIFTNRAWIFWFGSLCKR